MNERHAQLKKRNTRVNCSLCPASYSAPPAPPPAPRFKTASFNGSGNGEPLRNIPEGPAPPALSLELEIDESIKNLLRQGSLDRLKHSRSQHHHHAGSPQSLDVTIIQETETPVRATVSLGMDEVSQLIGMVRSTSNAKEQRDAFMFDYYTTDYATEDEEELYARGIVPPKAQQVYTSPQQTFNQIRAKLPCMAQCRSGEENFDKPGTPCLCQHCGMVGVLVESQKRPAIPHSPNPKFSGCPRNAGHGGDPRQSVQRNLKKVIDLRTKSKSETNLILLKELTSKISSLEDRLNDYEERTVKKDYFKFVIHKLLTQYSNKINELRTAAYVAKPNVNISTQYSKKQMPEKGASDRPERENSRYFPVKVTTNQVNAKSSTDDNSSERYYKSAYRAKSRRSPTGSPKSGAHVSTNVKTMFVSNNPSTSPFVTLQAPCVDDAQDKAHDNLSAHAIKNLCDIVYNKFCESSDRDKERMPVIPEKLLKPSGNVLMSLSKRPPEKSDGHAAPGCKNRCGSPAAAAAHCAKRMDVAYVSPALETWHDESEQEFAPAKNTRELHSPRRQHHQHPPPLGTQEKRNNSGRAFNASDAKNKPKHSIEDKIKYLKYLAKRKNVDECELWSNILNQARKHIRSNEDTVSIQLPSLVRGPEMSELELTLSMLKDIVRRSRQMRGKKSSAELNNRTSSERLPPPEHKRHSPRTTTVLGGEETRRHFTAR